MKKAKALSTVTRSKSRRVAIFVDNDNLYLSLRQAGYSIVEYSYIQFFARLYGQVTLARVYLAQANPPVEIRMRRAGFEPRYVSTNGYKRSIVDTQMIVDMMRYDADVYIVVTGDSDFEPAVRQLRQEGKYVVLMHLVENTSELLRVAAHEFHDYRIIQLSVQPFTSPSSLPIRQQLLGMCRRSLRVVKGHKSEHSPALIVRAGDVVEVGAEDSERGGWFWCTSREGVSDWVPQPFFENQRGLGVLLVNYNSTELDVTTGDRLFFIREVLGWIWCATTGGQFGWVPIEKVEDI